MRRTSFNNFASATKNDAFYRASGPTEIFSIGLGGNQMQLKENDCPFFSALIAACIRFLSTFLISRKLFRVALSAKKKTIELSFQSSEQPLPQIDSSPSVAVITEERNLGSNDVTPGRLFSHIFLSCSSARCPLSSEADLKSILIDQFSNFDCSMYSIVFSCYH